MEALQSHHTSRQLRRYLLILRGARQPGIQLRPMGHAADGLAEAVGPHHQHRSLPLLRQHRLPVGMGLEGPPRRAVGLHQHEIRHGLPAIYGRSRQLSLLRRHSGAGDAPAAQLLPQRPLLRADPQVRRRPYLGGGTHQHRPLLPQLRRQMIHQRGLAAAADKRRQSRPDLQQFPQFHPVIRPFRIRFSQYTTLSRKKRGPFCENPPAPPAFFRRITIFCAFFSPQYPLSCVDCEVLTNFPLDFWFWFSSIFWLSPLHHHHI